jgi:hypothetical protein
MNGPRWAELDLPNSYLLIDPIPSLCGLWRRNDVFVLRQALADLEIICFAERAISSKILRE